MTLSIVDDPTAAEARLRSDIAACTRLMNLEGVIGYSGHVSARLPDGDSFLVQDFNQSRATVSPEDLVICGLDGRVLSAGAGQRPPSEVFIHSEIFRARADVNAIAHFHHDLTTVFTLVEGVLLVPMKNHAMRWRSGIPVHPDPSHVDSPDLGRSLADTLGPHHAALIRAHGEVVVAEDARSLLIDCIHFVENAQTLHAAAVLGRVLPLTEAEMDAFARTFRRDHHVRKLWTYYVGRGRAAGVLSPALAA